MFKKITFLLALGFLFLGLNVTAQTPGFIVSPASTSINIGDTVVVAVRCTDFNDVIGFSHSINWDPAILQYLAAEDDVVLRALPPNRSINENFVASGDLIFLWQETFNTPTTIADDLVLYDIVRFTAIGAGTSPVEISGMPAASNIVTTNGEATPIITNSSITVIDPNTPNPPAFNCTFQDFGLAVIPDSAATGEQLCLDVYSCNWDTLTSVQYSINFNPAILQFDSIGNINIPQPENLFFNANNTDGWVVSSWLDSLNMGVDFPDTVAYQFCFTVIGAGGEMDTVRITGDPMDIDVTSPNVPNGQNIGMETQDAPIVVSGNSGSAITVVAANVEGNPGDTVCVAITTQNFNAITSFQYTMEFDENFLTYHELRNFNPNLPDLEAGINDSPMFTNDGKLLVVYPTPNGMPVSLMNGDTLYEVCYIIDANAPIGTNALAGFSDDPVSRGATENMPVPLLSNDGSVNVIPDNSNSGDLQLTIQDAAVCPDSVFCMPFVVVDGFTVGSADFTLDFPVANLTFVGLQNQNPAFSSNASQWSANSQPGSGSARVVLFNNSNPFVNVTLNPGDKIFDICFTAGNTVSDNTVNIQPGSGEFGTVEGEVIAPVILNDGIASITFDACSGMVGDITVTENITDVACNGDATGAIMLTINGGDGSYDIIWSGPGVNGASTPTISNLAAGMYTVSITSADRDFTETYTVGQPSVITGSTTSTNISCNGDSDGTINLTPGGGMPPYSYLWSNAATTQNLANLDPGTYTPTITDANMCELVLPSVTITEPAVLTITIDDTDNISCLDGNDGAISITTAGGNGGNMYNWSGPSVNGQITEDINSLTAGSYRVTVTDSEGCTAISPVITLTQPSTSMTITVDNVVPESCNDGGSIFISVTGGAPMYTYEWNNNVETQDLEDVPAGGYSVTVTDANECTVESEIIVIEATEDIVINSIITPPNCDSEADGAINLTVSGGTGDPFTYRWNAAANDAVTEDVTDLTADDYVITVTDTGDGCTATRMFQLTNMINLNILEVESTPAGCAGATNGSLTIGVQGGNGNYSYEWNTVPPQTDESLDNVAAGPYTVIVTDTNSGCTESANFTVDSEGGIDITANTITEASCSNADNGAIDIDVTGAGNDPTFAWSDGQGTMEDISGLEAMDYTVTVTSTDGQCTQTATFTVDSGDGFEIEQDGIAQATCDGAENGTVNISINGATGNVVYLWSNGETTQDINNAEGGSTVTVTATDETTGCVEMADFVIPSGNGFNIELDDIQNVSCGGATDGTINISLDGAVMPLTSIEWNGAVSATEDLINIPSGNYTVVIVDGQGCNATATYSIEEPVPITFSPEVIPVSCNGEDDGVITINPTGGTPSYDFIWSHDDDLIIGTATDLAPGDYTVTITDSRNCMVVTDLITVTEPDTIVITGTVTPVSGTGNDGAISVMATGGTDDFVSYVWTDPNGGSLSGQMISGLMEGTYTVTVTDTDGCTGTAMFTVNGADAPNGTATVTNATCFGGNDGAIALTVTGGSGGYSYNWQVPSGQPAIGNEPNPSNLIAGTYNVTITDDNGVAGVVSNIIVGEGVEIDYNLLDLLSVSCPGEMDGEINIEPTGGAGGPYEVVWNPAVNDPFNPTNLAAGIYTPIITDLSSGCTTEGDNITVQEPDSIRITLEQLVDPSCGNGEEGLIDIDVTGGTPNPNYIYSWEKDGAPIGTSSDELTNLAPGIYRVTVTDSRNCSAVGGPYELNGEDAIILQLDSIRHVRCAGIAEGAIFVTVSGGSGAPMPVWKNGQGDTINTGFDLIGLIGGNYTLCVTDNSGCSETLGPITVNEPQPITVDMIDTDNATSSADDGEIRLIGVDGGTPDYTYSWEGPNSEMFTTTDPTLSNIPPGNWRVTITDANNCTLVIPEILVEGSLNVQPIITPPTCNGGNDGSITLALINSTDPVEFEWSEFNGGSGIVDFAQNQFTLTAGSYSVTVEDGNGVVVVDTFNLSDPEPIIVSYDITNQTTSDCNGFINTTVSGGTPAYDYVWNNGETTEDLFNVCKGLYEVTITDDNGCISIPPAAIVTAGPLRFDSFNPPSMACDGGAVGDLTAEVFGGCGPYTFTITNGPIMTSSDGTVTFSGLTPGMYEITVTDLAGSTPLVATFEIAPTEIIVQLDTIINNTGPIGACNGAVNISVSGGQPLYTYQWSNGDTSQDISNVCENESPLNVNVVDANGCFVTSQEFILIRGLSIDLDETDETCFENENGSIISSVEGGNAPYTYEWSTGATTTNLTDLAPGSYILTVTDSQGRTVSSSANINGASSVISVTNDVVVPTGGNANGSITPSVTGGGGDEDYQWLRNGMEFSTAPAVAGLEASTYTLIITDAFNCVYTETFDLNGQPFAVSFEEGSTGCPGQGGDLGTLEAIVSGGSAPFTYNWSNGVNTNIIGGLAPGEYSVTVTDASGQMATGTTTLAPLQEIMIDLTVNEVDNTITSSVSGGTAPYTYRWNDDNFSSTRDLVGVPSGAYTLVISDANGCINQATVELFAGPCDKVRKVISPNNDGFNDEFIVTCANRFNVELEIYNRWGQLEFMEADYTNDWLGTDMDGAKLPEGGYFYVLRYEDSEGQTQQIKGSFNIVY